MAQAAAHTALEAARVELASGRRLSWAKLRILDGSVLGRLAI
jgi:hypothetical protein